MIEPRWQVIETQSGPHVVFQAENGEPVLSSQVYESRESARAAISLVEEAIVAAYLAGRGGLVVTFEERES